MENPSQRLPTPSTEKSETPSAPKSRSQELLQSWVDLARQNQRDGLLKPLPGSQVSLRDEEPSQK